MGQPFVSYACDPSAITSMLNGVAVLVPR